MGTFSHLQIRICFSTSCFQLAYRAVRCIWHFSFDCILCLFHLLPKNKLAGRSAFLYKLLPAVLQKFPMSRVRKNQHRLYRRWHVYQFPNDLWMICLTKKEHGHVSRCIPPSRRDKKYEDKEQTPLLVFQSNRSGYAF
jgi:hypothetical protein